MSVPEQQGGHREYLSRSPSAAAAVDVSALWRTVAQPPAVL